MYVNQLTYKKGKKTNRKPIYLDHAASTPVDPRVAEVVMEAMTTGHGNPHSRTHAYGSNAAKDVSKARSIISGILDASPEEVVFTSGATEANNLAILGLAEHLKSEGKTHIVSTAIEHKAVLEPLAHLEEHGFNVTLVPPNSEGYIDANAVADALTEKTGLVSIMHVNNETGVIQPIDDIATLLQDHDAFLHTDAAQSFGKIFNTLHKKRIDLISASGHKIGAPMGVGFLLTRRRGYHKIPLTPLQLGGSQERGLRGGTVAAPLVAGIGFAAELAKQEQKERTQKCEALKEEVASFINSIGGVINTGNAPVMPNMVSFRVPGLDADAALLLLKDEIAASTGSACTSATVEPSHVLNAMGLTNTEAHETMRWSWSHQSNVPEWENTKNLLSLTASD
jgi:cysteine desulfurase